MIEDQNKGVLTGVRMPLLPYLRSRENERWRKNRQNMTGMRETA